MMKRNLAATLAVLAISGAVVPMTANAAAREPFNIVAYGDVTPEVWAAWNRSSCYTEWIKSADIARKENESEYDYYLRLRDLVASNWAITTEVPKSVAQAEEFAKDHKADNIMFYNTLQSLINEKSDLMYVLDYVSPWKELDGSYRTGGGVPTRYTEMTDEYGQKQNVPSTFIHNCNYEHNWWEKDVFGVIRLDGKLYALKMTTDSSTCGTLIPYGELGYKNCDFSFGWNTNVLRARGYQAFTCKEVKWKRLQVYDADMSYDINEAKKTWGQWGVQGVLSYYCENGKIIPMTKALNDTLPKKDTNAFENGRTVPNGWKVFAD